MTDPNTAGASSSVTPSGSYLLDALLGATKWGGPQGTGAALTYSFPLASAPGAWFADSLADPYSRLEEPASTIHPFTNGQQASTADALAQWSAVAGVTFSPMDELGSAVGTLRFAFSSVPRQASWGWAYAPSDRPSGGDVWIDDSGVGPKESAWIAGGVNYEGILHEIGHAIGLKHPFEGESALPPALDDMRYSVMSYAPAPNDIFFRTVTLADGTQTSVLETIMPDTPMLLDIAAAQYLYGPNLSYRAGDDVYTFDPHQPFFRTIWDAGGTDTLSVANFVEGCTIDLRAGHFSSIRIHSDPLPPGSINYYQPTYDGGDNLAIAYGVTIENAVGGAGADTLVGNDADNVFVGGGGDDLIEGGAGVDTALYDGPWSQYAISQDGPSATVRDSSGREGTDTLSGVERLQFADKVIVLDPDGHLAAVLGVIAAVFGRGQVHDSALVESGLHALAAGDSTAQLMQLALDASPAGASAGATIDLVYANLTGAPPSDAVRAQLLTALESSRQSPAEMAAAAVTGPGSVGAALAASPDADYFPIAQENIAMVGGLYAAALASVATTQVHASPAPSPAPGADPAVAATVVGQPLEQAPNFG